jgi:hypothetical protein
MRNKLLSAHQKGSFLETVYQLRNEPSLVTEIVNLHNTNEINFLNELASSDANKKRLLL